MCSHLVDCKRGAPAASRLGKRTWKPTEVPLAEKSLFLVSLQEKRFRFSLFPRMLSLSLSHLVDIVTLTYEDCGIRFLYGPYCLLFHHFASRATFVARSCNACVYLVKLRMQCIVISRICQI